MDDFSPDQICFGLNAELDKQSLACFLQLIGKPDFSRELAERISEEDMNNFLDSFTLLMKKYFSEKEYHNLFLNTNKQG